MVDVSDKTSRSHWWDIDPPFWLGLMLCAALIVFLIAAPNVASQLVHPWVGVAVAVLAIPAWVYLGPRPMPGFLPGLIAISGLLVLLALLINAIVRAL